MRMIRYGILGLAAGACSSASGPGGDSGDTSLGPLVSIVQSAETVHRGLFSGISQPATFLITSTEQWSEVWARIHANLEPQPPAPAVDFGASVLLLDALGTSADGSTTSIEEVELHERGLLVRAVTESWSKNCLVLAVITEPVHVVRIPRPPAAADELQVERRTEVRDCT